jgi:hypothetical protein
MASPINNLSIVEKMSKVLSDNNEFKSSDRITLMGLEAEDAKTISVACQVFDKGSLVARMKCFFLNLFGKKFEVIKCKNQTLLLNINSCVKQLNCKKEEIEKVAKEDGEFDRWFFERAVEKIDLSSKGAFIQNNLKFIAQALFADLNKGSLKKDTKYLQNYLTPLLGALNKNQKLNDYLDLRPSINDEIAKFDLDQRADYQKLESIIARVLLIVDIEGFELTDENKTQLLDKLAVSQGTPYSRNLNTIDPVYSQFKEKLGQLNQPNILKKAELSLVLAKSTVDLSKNIAFNQVKFAYTFFSQLTDEEKGLLNDEIKQDIAQMLSVSVNDLKLPVEDLATLVILNAIDASESDSFFKEGFAIDTVAKIFKDAKLEKEYDKARYDVWEDEDWRSEHFLRDQLAAQTEGKGNKNFKDLSERLLGRGIQGTLEGRLTDGLKIKLAKFAKLPEIKGDKDNVKLDDALYVSSLEKPQQQLSIEAGVEQLNLEQYEEPTPFKLLLESFSETPSLQLSDYQKGLLFKQLGLSEDLSTKTSEEQAKSLLEWVKTSEATQGALHSMDHLTENGQSVLSESFKNLFKMVGIEENKIEAELFVSMLEFRKKHPEGLNAALEVLNFEKDKEAFSFKLLLDSFSETSSLKLSDDQKGLLFKQLGLSEDLAKASPKEKADSLIKWAKENDREIDFNQHIEIYQNSTQTKESALELIVDTLRNGDVELSETFKNLCKLAGISEKDVSQGKPQIAKRLIQILYSNVRTITTDDFPIQDKKNKSQIAKQNQDMEDAQNVVYLDFVTKNRNIFLEAGTSGNIINSFITNRVAKAFRTIMTSVRLKD